MTKILFICHGNICRSPMAEFIMKQLVSQAGRSADFEIDSAAVSTEEIGNDIYPPAKRMLTTKGVPFTHRAARQMTRADSLAWSQVASVLSDLSTKANTMSSSSSTAGLKTLHR